MLPVALENPPGIEMVSVCTGLLGGEGRVNTSVDTRLKPNTLTFMLSDNKKICFGRIYKTVIKIFF